MLGAVASVQVVLAAHVSYRSSNDPDFAVIRHDYLSEASAIQQLDADKAFAHTTDDFLDIGNGPTQTKRQELATTKQVFATLAAAGVKCRETVQVVNMAHSGRTVTAVAHYHYHSVPSKNWQAGGIADMEQDIDWVDRDTWVKTGGVWACRRSVALAPQVVHKVR